MFWSLFSPHFKWKVYLLHSADQFHVAYLTNGNIGTLLTSTIEIITECGDFGMCARLTLHCNGNAAGCGYVKVWHSEWDFCCCCSSQLWADNWLIPWFWFHPQITNFMAHGLYSLAAINQTNNSTFDFSVSLFYKLWIEAREDKGRVV